MPPARPATPPRSSVDASGRAIPLTEAQLRERAEAVARGLGALDEMGDEPEQCQTLETLMRGLDEDRTSDRKRSC